MSIDLNRYRSDSKFLKAADLGGKEFSLRINAVDEVEVEDRDGNTKAKLLVHFDNTEKGLLLNVTNLESIEAACGGDTDDWPGNPIILFPTKTKLRGNLVDCIRVRAPEARSQEEDDDIPF